MQLVGQRNKNESYDGYYCIEESVFCLIGAFVVIPQVGVFGWFWTLGALAITIYHAVNTFSDTGIASYEMVEEEEEYHFGKTHHSAEVEQRLKMVEH